MVEDASGASCAVDCFIGNKFASLKKEIHFLLYKKIQIFAPREKSGKAIFV